MKNMESAIAPLDSDMANVIAKVRFRILEPAT